MMPTTTPATGFTIAITCITWKQGWRILWPIGKDQLKDGGDGYLQLVFLFLGILCIGLVYAKTDNHRISHHVFLRLSFHCFWSFFYYSSPFSKNLCNFDCRQFGSNDQTDSFLGGCCPSNEFAADGYSGDCGSLAGIFSNGS